MGAARVEASTGSEKALKEVRLTARTRKQRVVYIQRERKTTKEREVNDADST